MKLLLQGFPLGQIKKQELSFEYCVLLIRDNKNNSLLYGQLVVDPDTTESIESQVHLLLKDIKKQGSHKADLHVTLVAIDKGPDEIARLIHELERFGLQLKVKFIQSHSPKILQINHENGDIMIPKVSPPRTVLPKPLVLVKKTKVLIVEDSNSVQKILAKIFSEIPNVEIVGIEKSPQAAAERLIKTKADLVTLDMHLDGGTGVDFLKKSQFKNYARNTGARCVLVTDCSMHDGNFVFDAMENGASSYIQKPQVTHLKQLTEELSDLIFEMFLYKEPQQKKKAHTQPDRNVDLMDFKLVAIGSSTGGTEIVREIIGGLPQNCPPIVVVQHMPSQFTGLYAQRIQNQTGRMTTEVTQLTQLEPNQAYIAAGGTHLTIEINNDHLVAKPKTGELVNRFMPSVSVLFASIEKAGLARHTIGIMLTGMGSDGAKEMRSLKDAGAYTMGQSKESCVVYGMPRAAEEMGALCWSASPEQMIYKLNKKNKLKSS